MTGGGAGAHAGSSLPDGGSVCCVFPTPCLNLVSPAACILNLLMISRRSVGAPGQSETEWAASESAMPVTSPHTQTCVTEDFPPVLVF